MGIFRVFFIGREIKKGINDPGGFLAEESLSFLKGFLIVGSLVGFIFILLFGILGFSSWLGGPYGFFKVLFWILFIPFMFIEIFLISIFLKIKKVLKHNLNRATLHIKSKIKSSDPNVS